MNIFDQFAKHQLKAKHYIRYADDFVFLSEDRARLEKLIPRIDDFLQTKLKTFPSPEQSLSQNLCFRCGFPWVGALSRPQSLADGDEEEDVKVHQGRRIYCATRIV